MKNTPVTMVILLAVSVLFTACAPQQKNINNGHAPVPQAQSDVDFVRGTVIEKIQKINNLPQLKNVNAFLDYQKRMVTTNRGVVISSSSKNFPPFLEVIFKSHPLLNKLPRDAKNLVVLESYRVLGTHNVFYHVDAKYIPEPFRVTDWIPSKEQWEKFVDPLANDLKTIGTEKQQRERADEEVFLSLFYEANLNKGNPELAIAAKAYGWKWDMLPHPKLTHAKFMLIPIATIRNSAMQELILRAQQQ